MLWEALEESAVDKKAMLKLNERYHQDLLSPDWGVTHHGA